MRFVHRLVIVAGFFLLIPVSFCALVILNPGTKPPTTEHLIIAALMSWIVAGLVIYPIAWLFDGIRR
jgi:hypothetical protein